MARTAAVGRPGERGRFHLHKPPDAGRMHAFRAAWAIRNTQIGHRTRHMLRFQRREGSEALRLGTGRARADVRRDLP